jgi:hypothetical protein
VQQGEVEKLTYESQVRKRGEGWMMGSMRRMAMAKAKAHVRQCMPLAVGLFESVKVPVPVTDAPPCPDRPDRPDRPDLVFPFPSGFPRRHPTP